VEDGGETEGEDGGKAKRAHTALDDEVGSEFAEKCGCSAETGATTAGGDASK
jgi:hypothetical protein